MKTALIFGVSGQDGSYLSEFLLAKGYKIWGTTRNLKDYNFKNLDYLNIKNKINLLQVDPNIYEDIFSALEKSRAEEVYFLTGQSSVGKSFTLPSSSIIDNPLGVLNLLEASKNIDYDLKLFFSGSGQCYGDTIKDKAIEGLNFNPVSPYAIGKVTQFWTIKYYRDTYNHFACTGILFNHESPLRPDTFVTKKIINSVHRIALGSKEKLILGRIDIRRDWGWAPDYVEAMWLMLQQKNPDDYIIATGNNYTLEEFVKEAFLYKKLNWKDHVKLDNKFIHKSDILVNCANPKKINESLNWKAKYNMHDIVKMMLDATK